MAGEGGRQRRTSRNFRRGKEGYSGGRAVVLLSLSQGAERAGEKNQRICDGRGVMVGDLP